MIHFEAVPDPTANGGGEPVEESWAGPSQEEWQQTQEALQGLQPLAEMYQQYEQQGQYPDQYADYGQQQQQPQPQFDPFADNAGDQMRNIIREEIQQATAPLNDLYSQVQYEQLESQARDILSDFKQANDLEFRGPEADDKVLALADKLAPQMAEQFGPGVKAAEAAIAQAANAMRDYEAEVGKAYHEQQMNQNRVLGSVQRQPDIASASVQSLATPTGGPQAVLQKYYGSGS